MIEKYVFPLFLDPRFHYDFAPSGHFSEMEYWSSFSLENESLSEAAYTATVYSDLLWCLIRLDSPLCTQVLFIAFQSMKEWITTPTHGVTRKKKHRKD